MLDFTPRLYQETIVGTSAMHNTLVVLPTGLGKTHIAMMLAAQRISKHPGGKVLMLAPTKPLVDQHADTFAHHLPDAESLGVVLTGRIKPEKRAEEFDRATYIFSTPQTIENDLLGSRITLKDVCLLILDEAHRAVGDYAYVYITDRYRRQADNERILALTASPGSKKQAIQEVVTNCGIEKLEVRSAEDPDVKPYVQDTEVQYLEVDLPDALKELQTALSRVIKKKLSEVKRHGHIRDVDLNKTQLLLAQKELQAQIRGGQPEPTVWRSISVLAEALKAHHALELIETQGIQALLSYLSSLERQAARGQSKAVKNLVSDPDFRHVIARAEHYDDKNLAHPKFIKLLSIVKLELAKNNEAKIIVFNQYRDQASRIVSSLDGKAQLFVGQQKKGETGLSQKEQKQMLTDFRSGQFPVLVATSVGEEGLDIPAVDLVIFYEPIPSAIRTIQRRGRTGRHDTGRVIVLVARDTRDVGYRWSAHHKEKRMYRNLKSIANSITPAASKQQSVLEDFKSKDTVAIVADSREKGSHVLKELQSLGVDLTLRQLDVGDYLLSKRVCVEYKTAEDFVNSLLDGRLMAQLRELTHYQRPLVLVEGADWYSQRNVHPNAIRGALSAIAVSFGVPILVTQNAKDTAALLQTIARREKQGGQESERYVSGRPMDEREEIVQVAAHLPGVGPVLAPKLLERFGTLRALANASLDELTQVPGIGKKKAKSIHDALGRRY